MAVTDLELGEWRKQFPVTKHWAFLDHAAVAAPPKMCAQAIQEWAHDLAENGIASFLKWYERVKVVRELAAKLINAHSQDVCFVGSTTQGINIIADGFPWQAGDNVVTVADEYPTNQYPWMNQQRHGVTVRAIPTHSGRVHVDELKAACDEHTRVLTISTVEFATGFRNDIAAIGEWCRSRGIFFMVDAIQSLGAFPLDVQAWPIDALAADSHKWLLGPEGAGICYINREWIDRLHPVGVGWNSVVSPGEFSTIHWQPKPHAGRYEGGTMNIGGILGMGESMRWLQHVGIQRVADRILFLTDYLMEHVPRVRCEVFSSPHANERSGIVAIDTPGQDPEAVKRRAQLAKIIVNVRGGHLRVSPHVYNTTEELDRLLAVLHPPTS
jgi:cysteine desulfurase / selenocysteine lyase